MVRRCVSTIGYELFGYTSQMSFTNTDAIFLVNMPKKSKAPSQGEQESSVSNDGSVIQLRVRKVQRRRFDHVPKDLEHDVGQKYVDSKRNPKFVAYILGKHIIRRFLSMCYDQQ